MPKKNRIALALAISLIEGLQIAGSNHYRGLVRRNVQQEEVLREEISKRNEAPSVVAPEASYDDGEDTQIERDIRMLNPFLLVVERSLQGVSDLVTSFSNEERRSREKRRIIILGSGWGSASLLKSLGSSARDDEITVISPRNFFLFTPMLCGAAVGTVEYRSITEPVRSLNRNVNYFEATATHIDIQRQKVMCEAVVCEGQSCAISDFQVDYDILVTAVGATTNTFGVPGVREYCIFLKQLQDAVSLRQTVGNCFERANLPTATDEDRTTALSFVIVGAGPTGVEFCSELRDFLQEEASRFYPHLLPYVKIHLLEATTTVLGAFDQSLRDVALDALQSPRVGEFEIAPVDVRLGTAVKEINATHVILGPQEAVPYATCVWAAGIAPLRVVADALNELGPQQTEAQSVTRGRLAVDPYLRVLGLPSNKLGTFFAMGDCCADAQAPLPATAQVAAQQGEFLARLFATGYDTTQDIPTRSGTKEPLAEAFCQTMDNTNLIIARPFQFLDLGALTYIGDSKALAQLPAGIKGQGGVAFALWRSVYIAKQMSLRNRLLIFGDWVRGRFFGRDLTRL
uniref:NADH:ubiquinone reductase (non-electrogenic) n=1 Tax=Aureoumbra lagunensis TaxID=44058 RepID=A0A6S8C9L8_9STRA